MERIWPDSALEKQMIEDGDSPSISHSCCGNHIKALLCRVRDLETEVTRLSPYGPGGEYYTPSHVLQFASDPAKPVPPLDIMANPPPNDLMTSALINHVGRKIDARYVGNKHDAEIIKAAADNPVPFTIVAQTENMAVVKVDGTEAIMVFGTEEMEP